MSEFKIAGLATIKEREQALKMTVDSIIDQVDVLMIYFNDYEDTPGWLKSYSMKGKIHRFGSIERPPFQEAYLKQIDIGDKGKFFTIKFCNGYYFSLDDDLIYPPDYIDRMIKAIEIFDREAIITNHGRVIPDREIRSYYRDTRAPYHFNNRVQGFHPVHIGGTGVMGFHTDTFRPDLSKMPRKNMADLYIADQAQDKGIPIIVQPHSSDWIKQNSYIDQRKSIFARNRTNDFHQTQLIKRRTSWQLKDIL